MSNIQAQNLISQVPDKSKRAHLRSLDDAISQLYCAGLITRAAMVSARKKLIVKIEWSIDDDKR